MVLGRLLGLAAILLQIAVFLQPLLPEKYQVSPVCETIAQALQLNHSPEQHSHHSMHHDDLSYHQMHDMTSSFVTKAEAKQNTTHHHDAGHQCQYCVVYSHVLPLPDLDLKQILVRIQIRFLAFLENFFHVFFKLQQLFLIPQGRAPPLLLSV
ncbi:DUF2946 family protein [Acinetobacter seifertii]|uniref:DUF2946 family protein n=1 Tax=Acinetobacter seifertii TaxID=1530123 RepID=UPI001C0B0404|nr:DUF2946 family protein [Acinetobacter seifertii]MBU3084549.1 DUF2946 family protein [Acinetobacter seifertii]